MTRRQRIAAFVLLAMGLFLVAALYQQLRHHYHRGEHAAYYTTFREDPMGASALYESLVAMPSLEVTRNLRGMLPDLSEPDLTLVYLGTGIHPDPVSFLEETEAFVEAGGRLVVAHSALSYWDLQRDLWAVDFFRRQFEEDLPNEEEEAEGEEADPEAEAGEAEEAGVDRVGGESQDDAEDIEEAEEEAEEEEEAPEPKYQDISERWGFDYGFDEAEVDEDSEIGFLFDGENIFTIFSPATAQSAEASAEFLEGVTLPESLPWRSLVYFTDLGPEWTALYTVEEEVVVMRRDMGAGEILLLSDSYVFSNESLKFEPRIDFLGWALGGHPRIVFNETHLGSGVQGNLMTLIRRYRLTGFLVAFLSIGLLYVWKSTVSLLPRRPDVEATQLLRVDAYHDATTTLSHLLRRGLGYPQLLQTAYEEWKKSRGRHQVVSPETDDAVAQCLALSSQRDYGNFLGARTRYAREALQRYNDLVALLRREERGSGRFFAAAQPVSSEADDNSPNLDEQSPPALSGQHTETELSGKDER